MRRASAPLVLAVVLVPALVRASELLVETEVRTLYDDNPGNVSTDARQEGDTAVRGDLRVRLISDEKGRFRGWLAYNPRYQRFFDLDQLNGWTHRADGEFEYLFSGRTTLSGAGRFVHTTSSRLDDEDFADSDVTPGDEEIDRGEFSLALAHRWAPRWASEFTLNYEFDRYERQDRNDFDSAGGVAALHYVLSPRHTLGGGLALTFQNLEGNGSQEDRATRFAGAFGSWGFTVNPRWSLNVQAGPVFIDADEADGPGDLVVVDPLVPRLRTGQHEVQVLDTYTCPSLNEGVTHSRGLSTFFLADSCEVAGPRLPQGLGALGPSSVQRLTNPQDFHEDSDSTTFFADATLARAGERTRWELTLQRTTGSNFGGSTSTVDSIVRSRFFWDPSPRWRFSLTATYTKRESATESSQIVEVVSPLGELQPGTPFPEVAIRTGELRVVQIDDAVDVDTYALHLRARRSFTRRLSAFVSLDYRRQENHGDFFGMGRETQRFRAAIGFTYGFDPIPL